MHLVVRRLPDRRVVVSRIHGADPEAGPGVGAGSGAGSGSETVGPDEWARFVDRVERDEPGVRWVWDDTAAWYPELLRADVRVTRCIDLRLCHAILRASIATAASALASAPPGPWDAPVAVPRDAAADAGALFDLDTGPADDDRDPVAEFAVQRAAVAGAAPDSRSRLSLLIAAESAGALIAAEMTFAGLPWDAGRHDAVLTELLGPRPAPGARPRLLEDALAEVVAALDVAPFSPESPGELLRALQSAGIPATSTRSWELKQFAHPAIEPLLRYKKLARLYTANGWNWLDQWVKDGRFRPTYVPGGVVSGRWASDGGGALQLPHQIRSAVVPDPGWTFIVADAAQLEPRILAALSGDAAMAAAARGVDLYDGMVAAGAVDTRAHAKVAMLGAMYGATTGESGRLLPRLARAYPRAIGFVEEAARAGERGDRVSTRLGRSSPRPGRAWQELQEQAGGDTATEAIGRRARTEARNWGRFTRNFVVQGSAAEWALCWMASLRTRLTTLAGGGPLTASAHLVFFLHDEIVVHSPAAHAETVAGLVIESAAEAGRLIFGDAPVDFPVTTAIVSSYDQAK
ncbi:bifunctional 3'-5' exonuclease/DNA polymerase [Labedella populi]|uniref:DNA-directed DNA polymerase n=1 Tax=Labedella populi TaxID=2498850 RepID=A0A3S5CP36_9MICO|nr:bifunctional 3'-5' exonuclease/DNA polymerase [Labedella populi]RWZ67946.1 bifunctional 3'-5' exonuclease/DNA polymerase [Labedella populi]